MKKFEELVKGEQNEGKKIFLFSTDWCTDCIILNAYIDDVVEQNKEWEFIYVDADIHSEYSQQNDILGIPSFVAYDNGKRVSDLISKDAKPESLINSWIKTIGKV